VGVGGCGGLGLVTPGFSEEECKMDSRACLACPMAEGVWLLLLLLLLQLPPPLLGADPGDVFGVRNPRSLGSNARAFPAATAAARTEGAGIAGETDCVCA
jgi:hypothetical protein